MILDTCALLWLAAGAKELTDEARRQIDAAPVVWVSAISALEIAVKSAGGKLRLPTPPASWWAATIEHHGLAVIPVDADVCFRAVELPPIHRDPADRIIIATALLRGTIVVTTDSRFAEYGIETLC